MEPRRRELVLAALQGLWIYLLILWGYIVADSWLFPQYQYMAISVYVPLRQNMLADIAFPLSLVCFVLWRYLGSQPASPGQDRPGTSLHKTTEMK
ncbi:MAG TPA: hypothetical protein VLX56_05935 [Nitrososphaerales archaeon]|nr:hypothetical protein [Nitrososphaerales archaeon]